MKKLLAAGASIALFLAVSATATQPPPSPSPSPSASPSPAPPLPDSPSAAASSTAPPPAPSPSPSPWDVARPPGPSRDVVFDVDEGTWMNLDVSPDGRDIAFDLLGDVYLVPIAGGEAKALTNGHAWDMQPRFSPDGKRIAFTSDRGGGDNVWVMDRDGANAKAVTKETFRLLNSPAWTPDGEYIGARKHFTSRRSIGAGEIWLYHRTGGEGLQMTKRPNDQKDVGEPVFSPDGRYLYYSQDATPGGVFEYNKNVHDEIYVIQRLDRETGDIDRFVSGAGGSIRPTPSRDGKRLAFVRRVGLKTTLFVKDLDSGRERPVFDGLERDMQETWAIHGVYPAMAWTPDDRAVVLWAGGKIHRVEADTGAASAIPFRVKAAHRLADALRFPIEAEPERWPVRMLRWVQVSPRGDKVVYEALGRLWVRDLPDGTPRRLTAQDDHLELYPSWSRDGRQIVYVSWDDEKLASIRVVGATGGPSRVVTDEPGHYVEPAFSPDGKHVVFRRVRGGYITSPLWSASTGIFWAPASGGRATLVTRRGRLPHFGAASDRVYLLRPEEEDKRALVSIELDGSDERSHLQSETATEFRVSADDRWVAFREGFNAFIAPFARTGKRQDIGQKTKAVPVSRVSKDAGEYLHWSGDGRSLHWSLGPELFTRDLTESFAFVAGAPEKLPEVPARSRNIGFEARTAIPAGSVAVVGGRVVTMKGDEVIEDGVVLVEGHRIKAVGPRAQVTVPAGARVVDAAGMTVLPGIVDVHWHGSKGSDQIVPERNWVDDASLAFGVTTVHDPSNDTSEIFAAAEMARAGIITGPRTFSTGTILYGAAGDFKAEIDSLDDARAHLRRMKAVGAFSVKSYNQPRRDQRQQVITAARELEMMVVPEGGSLFHHNMTMVLDGHTGIEHAIPVPRVYADVRQLWGRSGSGYTPTIVVGYGGIWGENYWYQHTKVWEHPKIRAFVPPFVVEPRARRRPIMAEEDDFNHVEIARTAKALSDAGVSVQVGAHGQREGLGAHWEMWMFVQGGMTPHQALRAGTLSGARYLGLDRDLGSLEPGKLADLFVVEGNPLQDIRTSDRVRYTLVGGRLYDARTMDELWPAARKRPPGFWQEPQPGTLERMRGDAARFEPQVKSPWVRRFLRATRELPPVAPRAFHRTADRSRWYTPDQAAALPEADRAVLQKVDVGDEVYYERYSTPLAYARPLDILAEHGFEPKGRKLVDFGYGNVGQLKLLALLGAHAKGIEVDPLLPLLYARENGPVRAADGTRGDLRLFHGRFPNELAREVGTGYDLFLSKNTLKRGYVHPEKPVPERQRIDLGVSDAEYVKTVYGLLNPGGLFFIYNLAPAPAPEGKPYIPWADGRSPFTPETLRGAGFEVIAFDSDDSVAARAMARALGWDKGESPMDVEKDLFALYTLARKPR